MKVHVCNQDQASRFIAIDGGVVISITEPGGQPSPLMEGWKAVLRLEFHDVVDSVVSLLVSFNDQHAEAIHGFIKEFPESDYMIHCGAGLSRSMAVGVFMRDFHNATLVLHATNTDSGANSLVLRKLKKKLWLDKFAHAILQEGETGCF